MSVESFLLKLSLVTPPSEAVVCYYDPHRDREGQLPLTSYESAVEKAQRLRSSNPEWLVWLDLPPAPVVFEESHVEDDERGTS